MTVDLSNYVDVAERIRLFFEAHPDGSIQATTPHPIIIQESVFLEVTATVYRHQDDYRPSVATAWEPFPGTTPYTRNSEAMNCETSAAGRALAFLGFGIRRNVASADEVANRDPAGPPTPGRILYDRLTGCPPELQKILKAAAKTRRARLTVAAFDADPVWREEITAILYDADTSGWPLQ